MRSVGLVLALAACAIAALVLYLGRGGERGPAAAAARAPASAPGERDAGLDRSLAELTRRVDELALTVTALEDEVARLRETRRAPSVEAPVRPVEDAAGERNPERSASWYLEQYVASFEGGGEGSEYFRLAVEAFAPGLLREIGALVLDPGANVRLRLSLLAMLADARFRGNRTAIDLCLRLVPARGDGEVVASALAALQRIGDPGTARALEGLLWSIETLTNRWKAVQALVALSQGEANAALARLWPLALDDADRSFLIGLVTPAEGVYSLGLFEQASLASQPVRLQAALAIGEFRFDAFEALVDEWSAREPDETVRAALGAARESLTEAPRWSAERACGPPDADASRDDPNAWAPAEPDMGTQWLELDYDPPLRASAVRIHEVCVAGAVTAVTALGANGERAELWSGADPTTSPGLFELAVGPTAFRVRTLRLTLDTDRRPGWSEIDAVELVGADGRAWASGARASSSFGR